MNAQAPQRRATWQTAYDAQMALWRWTRPEMPGVDWLTESFQESARGLEGGTRKMLMTLYGHENAKLFQADPVFVSAEMCELVAVAAESFQPEPLLPTDILTAFGFIYYEQPFHVPDRFGTPLAIHAISWAPMLGDRGRAAEFAHTGDEVLRYLQERDYGDLWQDDDNHVITDEEASVSDGLAITIYAQNLRYRDAPAIVPMHVTPWWFGMTFEGNEVDEKGVPTGAAWWWKIAQTTFRLMQQTITQRSHERPDRPTRRQASRYGFAEREIVVVRLRRHRDPTAEPGEGKANYSHQFIVSGHWRNQFYPASGVHRQIWISPYVKGDESLPLVIRPRRVFNWSQ